MIQTEKLSEYKGSGYLRTYMGGPPKMGKTSTCLSLLRGSRGRVCDRLHIYSFDAGAIRTLKEDFARQQVPDLEERLVIHNFETLANGDSAPGPNESEFFPELVSDIDRLRPTLKGNLAAVWFSGTGAMVEGLQREIRFTVGKAPPDSMDQYRWVKYGNQIDIIRAKAHGLPGHVVWEVQVVKWGESEDMGESQLIQGKQAGLFAQACEQALRLSKKPGATGVRYFDTRPNWPWMRTSRVESLLPPIVEPADFSIICEKLELPMAEQFKK